MNDHKTRVLVAGLKGNRQGTEMAVDNFVRAVGDRCGFDYLLHEEPVFDGCRAPGNRAFAIPRKSKDPLGYRREILKLFEDHSGEWDAVWLNTGNLANIDVLKMAERYGVPRRILHAHTDTWLGGWRQLVMTRFNHRRALKLATDRWACAEGAGRLFYGKRTFTVVPNGIPFDWYSFSENSRQRVRMELDVEGKFIVGSVGALISRKNHAFLLELLARIVERGCDACLLVVGEGPEREKLIARAENLGLASRVLLPGSRDDVPAYLSAMDVFAFPSLHEGLSLALIEAQANGLPVVASSACTLEAAITDSIRYIDLADKELWTDALSAASRSNVHLMPRAAMFNLLHEGAYLTDLFIGTVD